MKLKKAKYETCHYDEKSTTNSIVSLNRKDPTPYPLKIMNERKPYSLWLLKSAADHIEASMFRLAEHLTEYQKHYKDLETAIQVLEEYET